MSKSSLPDLLGVHRLKADGGALALWRRVLNLRGEVEIEDVTGRGRIDMVVGAPAVITPAALTATVNGYSPEGFETASVVMVSASVAGVQINGLEREGILTLRRTFVNIGAHAIDFLGEAPDNQTVTVLPNHSMLAVFDPVEGMWVLQMGLPSGDPGQLDFSDPDNSALLGAI